MTGYAQVPQVPQVPQATVTVTTPTTNTRPHCTKCGAYLDKAPDNAYGWCNTCQAWAQMGSPAGAPLPSIPEPLPWAPPWERPWVPPYVVWSGCRPAMFLGEHGFGEHVY